MELKWVFKVELSILIVSWKHTLVSSRRVRSTLTRTRSRARGVGDEAQCGALMAHFARSHRREPLESRLCIFDRARVVKHKGCKDQVVGDAAHDVAVMRMRARVHEAPGWAHGAWVLLCRARRTRVSQCGATVWRARIDSQVTWCTPHRRMAVSQYAAPRAGARRSVAHARMAVSQDAAPRMGARRAQKLPALND
ncbi:hypothetical protein HanXRQr2_Chr06g0238411 [Helianthus annuus]|uniref:Uncharacterized protein n=1 Tax=Helianthus annuus TaxID=4232 RepID=A0A9K3IPT7_HELAN|nr:hypothetical protein HanXRQr2_Chr06g0238411 [Helianthus annuus]